MKKDNKTIVVFLRLNPAEKQMLDDLTALDGETQSVTLRRLIREAHSKMKLQMKLMRAPGQPCAVATLDGERVEQSAIKEGG